MIASLKAASVAAGVSAAVTIGGPALVFGNWKGAIETKVEQSEARQQRVVEHFNKVMDDLGSQADDDHELIARIDERVKAISEEQKRMNAKLDWLIERLK